MVLAADSHAGMTSTLGLYSYHHASSGKRTCAVGTAAPASCGGTPGAAVNRYCPCGAHVAPTPPPTTPLATPSPTVVPTAAPDTFSAAPSARARAHAAAVLAALLAVAAAVVA